MYNTNGSVEHKCIHISIKGKANGKLCAHHAKCTNFTRSAHSKSRLNDRRFTS